jgi:hypothetical protein
MLPNGSLFQNISHVTEVGWLLKLYWLESKEWNCGELSIVDANDFEHRLKPKNF